MLDKLGPNSSKNDLPGYVRRSFKGPVLFVELPRGMKLFTLSQRKGLKNPKGRGHGEVTQWWSPYKRFKGDVGYKARFDLAQNVRMEPLDVFKDTGAYANEKAGLRYVVVARLDVPVWAAFGRIRREGKVAAANTGHPIKCFQFYIPGMDERLEIRRIGAIDLIQSNAPENAAVNAAADVGGGASAAA
jgi:hypothetical protein